MAEHSSISWTDDTFNPWEGCQKVGPGCDGCYAEARNARFGGGVAANWGPGAPRRRTSKANWRKPLKWDREATADALLPFEQRKWPRGRFVFCASLADVFDNAVPTEWRRDLFDLIRATPHLTWLLLTKRPSNIVKLFHEAHPSDPDGVSPAWEWPRNAAIGCTVVDQGEANRDVPKLLSAKARLNPAFAFLSMEPLLGPVDLEHACLLHNRHHTGALDWVITGGETDQGGHKARPAHPDWFRDLRDQCAKSGVAFHFKQWGEWTPGENAGPVTGPQTGAYVEDSSGDTVITRFSRGAAENLHVDDEPDVWRVGKKAAGRLLDGVAHDRRPEVAAC